MLDHPTPIDAPSSGSPPRRLLQSLFQSLFQWLTVGMRPRLLGLALVFGLLAPLLFPIDLQVARWCRTKPLAKEAMRLIEFSEIFAHGIGVASLLAALLALDPSLRPWRGAPWRGGARESDISTAAHFGRPGTFSRFPDFVRFIAATITGGLLVDILKISVTRIRPRAANLDAVSSAFETFSTAALADPTVAAHAAGLHRTDLMSFPSGHSAIATGFAAALIWKYPHGWPAFIPFAALAVAQRLFASAHYPSDTAMGVALGLLGAALWLGPGPNRPTAPLQGMPPLGMPPRGMI